MPEMTNQPPQTATVKQTPTPRKRWRLLQLLGGVGVGLAALLVLGTWGLTLLLGPMIGEWLSQASAGLTTLDNNLSSLITALEPLDILARPETLGAVQALGELAERVEKLRSIAQS